MLGKFVVTSIIAALATGPALAQANLKPDTTPRLPPQAGQGLPFEDQQFLVRAANLSEAEAEAARLAIDKVSAGPVKEFAGHVAADHQKLREAAVSLAQKHQVKVEPHASRATWQADLARLRGQNGEAFERDFLQWQLQIHLSLVDLYQTEASNTPATELAQFAIVTLKEIQARFDEAKQLAAQRGITINTIRQPPQY
jgi:predicted outer membrane protein